MIFYFSGTGNSYCVAKEIAEATNEKLISIAEAWRKSEFTYTLVAGERLGFVYPIHAWAPPTIVKRFIKRLKIKNSKGAYTYSVLTCGDTWEGAAEHTKHALKHIGISLQGSYTIIMPNNYAIGHELDTKELEQKKLVDSIETVKLITKEIVNKTKNYKRANYSFIKSYIVYALFQLSKVKSFFHVNNQCVGCGICEKVCPMKVIKMKQKRNHKVPSWGWGKGCVQCSACINVCPRKAINYMGLTQKRRRYFNPEYRKKIRETK